MNMYRMYKRYGGLSQTWALTEEEKKYDDTCREIDKIEKEIAEKSMALFTAGEFMWFSHHVNKLHFFPKQTQLDQRLSDLRNLLASLEIRSTW